MFIYLLCSARRCSGKDTCADFLKTIIEHEIPKNLRVYLECRRPAIANSLKRNYAKDNNFPVEKLMLNEHREFKEQHRLGLIQRAKSDKAKFGDDVYIVDMFNYEEEQADPLKVTVPLVSDARYKIERYAPMKHNYKHFAIRINATDETRQKRGWKFDPAIDLDPSECDLDHIDDWDLVIDNNASLEDFKRNLEIWALKPNGLIDQLTELLNNLDEQQ